MQDHILKANCTQVDPYSFKSFPDNAGMAQKYFCHFGCEFFTSRSSLMLHLARVHSTNDLFKWGLRPDLLLKFGLALKYKKPSDFIKEV